LAPLESLFEATRQLQPLLPEIRCPVLLLTSVQDHVVPPSASDHLAAVVSGPVERVMLERSYHVATLDYDKAEIEARAVEFARKVSEL
jgi:carboxylesterase